MNIDDKYPWRKLLTEQENESVEGKRARLEALQVYRSMALPDKQQPRSARKDAYILALIESFNGSLGEVSFKTILTECPWNRQTVWRAMKRLLLTGKIMRSDRGLYRKVDFAQALVNEALTDGAN